MRPLAIALAFALALAGGCFGKGGDQDGALQGASLGDAIDAVVGPSAEELARTPGTLRGVVHTPELAPILGATVADERLGLNVSTDAAGAFTLPGLVTGQHQLTVAAVGYLTRSVMVQTTNGTTLEVNVSLTPAPHREPFVETRELQGFLSCAALVQGERQDCATADPNHRDIFEFELIEDGKGAVLELVWDAAATPLAPQMTLTVETVGYGAQDLDLGNATGNGYARVEVPVEVMEKYYPEGGLMRARVTLAPGDAPVSATAQSSFVVYASVFYHGAAPAGFSILSG